ncbi:AMP-binding protein, partial [Patescibacteria group bacterium]
MKTLDQYLTGSARKWPNRQALIMKVGYRTISFTYKETLVMAKKIALFMKKQGVKKGDMVMLMAPSSHYWVCIFWACILMGAIIVPLNTQATTRDINHILKQTKAKLLFKFMFYKQNIPRGLKHFDIELIEELVENFDASDFKTVQHKEADLAEIMYTSGTTGDPKGVMYVELTISAKKEWLSDDSKR